MRLTAITFYCLRIDELFFFFFILFIVFFFLIFNFFVCVHLREQRYMQGGNYTLIEACKLGLVWWPIFIACKSSVFVVCIVICQWIDWVHVCTDFYGFIINFHFVINYRDASFNILGEHVWLTCHQHAICTDYLRVYGAYVLTTITTDDNSMASVRIMFCHFFNLRFFLFSSFLFFSWNDNYILHLLRCIDSVICSFSSFGRSYWISYSLFM